MTEIHKYVCDLCKKEFESKDECHRHEISEWLCELEKFSDYAILSYFDGETITDRKEIPPIHPGVIQVFEDKGITLVENFFDLMSWGTPWDSGFGDNKKIPGVYLWNREEQIWFYLRLPSKSD